MLLTLDQLDDSSIETVWFEFKYPEYSSGYRKRKNVRATFGSTRGPNRALYGKTWRCWTEKPSEEEQIGAKWKEDGKE